MRFFNTPYYKNARKLHFCMALFPEGRLSAESCADSASARREPPTRWTGLAQTEPLCRGHPQAGRCLPAGSCAECHTNFLHHNSSTFPKVLPLFFPKYACITYKNALCTKKVNSVHLIGERAFEKREIKRSEERYV